MQNTVRSLFRRQSGVIHNDYALVKALSRTVNVRSTPGNGATFSITLPY